MNLDKRQVLTANLVDQWTNLSFRDKKETVEDAVAVGTICGTLMSSAICAARGNWPAAFYNLALGGGFFVVMVAVSN